MLSARGEAGDGACIQITGARVALLRAVLSHCTDIFCGLPPAVVWLRECVLYAHQLVSQERILFQPLLASAVPASGVLGFEALKLCITMCEVRGSKLARCTC